MADTFRAKSTVVTNIFYRVTIFKSIFEIFLSNASDIDLKIQHTDDFSSLYFITEYFCKLQSLHDETVDSSLFCIKPADRVVQCRMCRQP